MSNIEYDGQNIDDIIRILNDTHKQDTVIKGTQQAIKQEEEELDKRHPNRGWYNADGTPMSKQEYQNMLQLQTAKKIIKKSIRKPPISTRIITQANKTMEFINKNKLVITGILATLVLVTASLKPFFKANGQISDLSNKLGNELQKMKYGEKQDGLFQNFRLTIEPNKLVDNLGLNPNDHIRLYILSTVLNQTDFESVLQELGFNNSNEYAIKLGFEHNERRAIENYQISSEEMLQELIMNLNKNPEKVEEYLEKYPELGFIYDPNKTFLTAGGIASTRTPGGRR
jgi:hypothetical protein